MKELKVKTFEPKDGIKISHRKENHLDRAYVVLDKKGKEIAELRTYWPGSNCYACLWVHYGDENYASGSGVAGGYGYDRRSAAASQAFTAAGITMTRNFNGTGETLRAMEALGKHLAKRSFLTVIEVYG